MKSLTHLRKSYQLGYITESELKLYFGAPGLHSRLSRLVAKNELIRIKKGFYLFGPDYQQKSHNYFSIANLLYGPSYVSLESALSFYQMIPESSPTVMSINIKRKKSFNTTIGYFIYRKIPAAAFSMGVISKTDRFNQSFLIATAEKALLDKLYLDSTKEINLDNLVNNLRIDLSHIYNLNIGLLKKLSYYYNCNQFFQRIAKLTEEVKKLNK